MGDFRTYGGENDIFFVIILNDGNLAFAHWKSSENY